MIVLAPMLLLSSELNRQMSHSSQLTNNVSVLHIVFQVHIDANVRDIGFNNISTPRVSCDVNETADNKLEVLMRTDSHPTMQRQC